MHCTRSADTYLTAGPRAPRVRLHTLQANSSPLDPSGTPMLFLCCPVVFTRREARSRCCCVVCRVSCVVCTVCARTWQATPAPDNGCVDLFVCLAIRGGAATVAGLQLTYTARPATGPGACTPVRAMATGCAGVRTMQTSPYCAS